MRCNLNLVFAAAILAAAAVLGRAADAARLDVTLAERIDCSVLTPKPCFRLSLRSIDGHIPPADAATLLSQFRIAANGAPAVPFYVQPLSTASSGGPQNRVTLILLDISGSMNEQLYAAAVNAAK